MIRLIRHRSAPATFALLALFTAPVIGVAQTPAPAAAGDDVLHLQVLLDRAGFSPGEIDGRAGENTVRAVNAFAQDRGLPADPAAPALLGALGADKTEVLRTYTITAEDVAGPFTPEIPASLEEQAGLPALRYRSAIEALGEQFHCAPELLKALNPDARFAEGEQISVPNVAPPTPPAGDGVEPPGGVDVTVSRTESTVTVRQGQRIVFHAPATTGSERDPLPIGEWAVTAIARDPTFHYNPDLFWDADPAHAKATLPPGPNGPVGVVWIDLTREHYGIHGTPEPANVGHTASHGCVRLTNWDARRVAALVSKGTAVHFVQ
jgi:lipoprotein-anchoring transpeptidase ErfK/SrfK